MANIQSLHVSSIAFDLHDAMEIANEVGVCSKEPVLTDVSFVFIARPASDFKTGSLHSNVDKKSMWFTVEGELNEE